jgi:hypothetical protein
MMGQWDEELGCVISEFRPSDRVAWMAADPALSPLHRSEEGVWGAAHGSGRAAPRPL